MNIYVGNLSSGATDVAIRQAFESFGEVTLAKVIKDKYSGQSRGFCICGNACAVSGSNGH